MHHRNGPGGLQGFAAHRSAVAGSAPATSPMLSTEREKILAVLEAAVEKARRNHEGAPADYIPELARVDLEALSAAVTSLDATRSRPATPRPIASRSKAPRSCCRPRLGKHVRQSQPSDRLLAAPQRKQLSPGQRVRGIATSKSLSVARFGPATTGVVVLSAKMGAVATRRAACSLPIGSLGRKLVPTLLTISV